jgi:hypothetical protein
MTKDRSTKPSSSPKRNTFQVENYLKRCADTGLEPSPAYLDMWEQSKQQAEEWCQQTHENNMEYDLRTSEHMLSRARSSKNYAQNLYAAMCNREFQRNDTWPILTDQKWSSEDGYGLSGTVPEVEADGSGYVTEGVVTDEIRVDLFQLGWRVLDDSED